MFQDHQESAPTAGLFCWLESPPLKGLEGPLRDEEAMARNIPQLHKCPSALLSAPPGGRLQHPLEPGDAGGWRFLIRKAPSSLAPRVTRRWRKELLEIRVCKVVCHTYGQAKLVRCDVTSCETKTKVLKSWTFPSRASERVEKPTWASNCRFFFSSFFSPPSCKLILEMDGRREKDQVCRVASFC